MCRACIPLTGPQVSSSNQSILKEISPEYSLEGLMLKLKLQYLGHLIQRTDSLEKTLMLGKVEDGRRGRQKMKWLDGITDSMDMSLSKFWKMVKDKRSLACCSPWDHKESDMTEVTQQQQLVKRRKVLRKSCLLFLK